MSSSLILIVSGALCFGGCWILFYKAKPREGRHESALVATETRAMGVGLLLMILFIAGLTLMVKGVLE